MAADDEARRKAAAEEVRKAAEQARKAAEEARKAAEAAREAARRADEAIRTNLRAKDPKNPDTHTGSTGPKRQDDE